jgi:hypothetical protein
MAAEAPPPALRAAQSAGERPLRLTLFAQHPLHFATQAAKYGVPMWPQQADR